MLMTPPLWFIMDHHKICENKSFHWPVFFCKVQNLGFCLYTGKYGSVKTVKTQILSYFTQFIGSSCIIEQFHSEINKTSKGILWQIKCILYIESTFVAMRQVNYIRKKRSKFEPVCVYQTESSNISRQNKIMKIKFLHLSICLFVCLFCFVSFTIKLLFEAK